MTSNTNPETGIRYGIISAHSLHPDIIDEIQSSGRDVHYEEAQKELRERVIAACEDVLGKDEAYDVGDCAVEKLGMWWQDEEPIHEFDVQGVKGQTTWLGGALLVWIFESPYITTASMCSPCVPNCGDLDHQTVSGAGYECYDVPPDWREQDA